MIGRLRLVGLTVLPMALAGAVTAAGCAQSIDPADFGPTVDGAATGDELPSLSGPDASLSGSDDGGSSPAFDGVSFVPLETSPGFPQGNLYTDFPPLPVIDSPIGGTSTPSNSGSLFGAPSRGTSSGGPCLVEPEVSTLFPRNWLRPRFGWIPGNGENLFELRVHAANQTNDLVVYTSATQWTMPNAMWDSLRVHSDDVAMTVTVRGGIYAGGALGSEAIGSSGSIGIAPVDTTGSIVYWTTTNVSSLKGFSIGQEGVTQVLLPSQVQEAGDTCIGCHTLTPDCGFASFCTQVPFQNGIAEVDPAAVGQVPPFLGGGAKQALQQSRLGISTFSKAHWAQGDRIEITGHDPNNDGRAELIWIDLEAQVAAGATGVLARTGDAHHAGAPSWSHDGKTIAYVSTDANKDGRLDNGPADLYSIPYNSRAGGLASPVSGAANPNYEEYYPAYSPDDSFIAFDRVQNGVSMYNAQPAEVFVLPSAGGTPTRLVANDPPACTGKTSPGVTNSWPKWAPSVGKAANGRTYYWIVFSSTRAGTGNVQLYMTAVVVDVGGSVTTYGALHLWNQPATESNHTPSWDDCSSSMLLATPALP